MPSLISLSGWRSDILHAGRAVFRHRIHSLGVIAGLSTGLIVSITTFSVFTSIMGGDQPGVHDRGNLVTIWVSRGDLPTPSSLRDFEAIRSGVPATGQPAAEGPVPVAFLGRGASLGTTAALVSGNYFDLLGTAAIEGRLLSQADDDSAAMVAVVSEHLWRSELGGRPEAIGTSILVSGRSFVIVGVAEPRFHGLEPLEPGESQAHGPQIWIPIRHARGWPGTPADTAIWFRTVARLRPDFTVTDARSQFSALSAQLPPGGPGETTKPVISLQSHGFGPGDVPFDILLVLAAILSVPLTVLLIGCANVANLQLARASERARELAVRVALGASRARLVRLLVVEALGLASVAVGFSTVATLALLRIGSDYFPFELSLNGQGAAFAAALLVSVTLLTGLMPAWLVVRRGSSNLTARAQGAARGHSRLRNSLVVLQVALSLVMLCACGIFLRSVQSMHLEVPQALRSQLVVRFDPTQVGGSPAETRRLIGEIESRLQSDSRVVGVSLSRSSEVRYAIGNEDMATSRYAALTETTPAWLDVMGVRLLAGQPFAVTSKADVAIVSARLAETIAPDGNAVGHVLRIKADDGPVRQLEIVGVAADNRARPMVTGSRPDPVIYVQFAAASTDGFTLRVKTRDTSAFAAELRGIVGSIEPRLPWLSLRTAEEMYLEDAGGILSLALSLGGAGMIALVLAAAGLYAVMAYVVQLRRREIGVRLAVGADRRQIVTLVMREALRLVAVGSAIGLSLAIPLAFLLRSVFVGTVTALDPVAFTPPLAALLLAGLVAAAIPARRAAHLNPIQVLRED